MAKFQLRKVAKNTRKRDSTRQKGARRTRNAPFMMPCIPGAVHVNGALMRLPALKVKNRGENMCNLSQKEGRSLFAVPAKRQKKGLPMKFHLHKVTLFLSLWLLDLQLIKYALQPNKKQVKGEELSSSGGGVLFFHSGSRLMPYTHSPQGKMTFCCPQVLNTTNFVKEKN